MSQTLLCSFCKYFFKQPALISRIQYVSITRQFYKSSRHTLCMHSRKNEDFDLEDENNQKPSVHPKVIYNSSIHKMGFLERKRAEKKAFKLKGLAEEQRVVPVSLKYLTEFQDKEEEPPPPIKKVDENDGPVNMPYASAVVSNIATESGLSETESTTDTNTEAQNVRDYVHMNISDYSVPSSRRWMNDYEKYTGVEEEDNGMEDWQMSYGTPSIETPVSKVPCGGCGALLHCQDTAIPGYLPSEIFKECSDRDLRALTCQRCHFMKNYNTALSVSVDKAEYPKIISKIKNENALVLIMVDLTDFPCSIWPGIFDIIGKNKNVFVVGNKIDLLWGDSRGWLRNVHSALRSCFPSNANVRHTALISAKTGFGVEELITKLHTFWQYKGDVYLVGCTNVGKSTLFNSLLQSDYCKVKAVDLVQRATTAPWPGTTLNLLKFPILRPEGWRLYLRTLRLVEVNKQIRMEKKLLKDQLRESKVKVVPPQLIGHIGRTFDGKKSEKSAEAFNLPNRSDMFNTPVPQSGLDPKDPDFAKTKWFYDTPGVLHEDQILDLLTTEELILTVPKSIIEPRTFLLHPELTLFIAGLARLDYVGGKDSIRATVFSSAELPITICRTRHANEIYEKSIGTSVMLVPSGPQSRLNKWPGLQKGATVSFSGIDSEESCGDIVLSSAGWVSIAPAPQSFAKLLPWTPLARGIHARVPALLPHAVKLRGPKYNKSLAYGKTKPFI